MGGPGPAPHEPFRVALEVIGILEGLGVPCAVGGSVASSAWGFPRSTRDVDLVARLTDDRIGALSDALRDAYYADVAAIRDAIRRSSSFNVIHLASVLKVDVFVPGPEPWNQAQLDRRRFQPIGSGSGAVLPLVSPEDIILQKLRWYRLGGELSRSQWSDVLAVLRVQGDDLDSRYLSSSATAMGLAELMQRAREALLE